MAVRRDAVDRLRPIQLTLIDFIPNVVRMARRLGVRAGAPIDYTDHPPRRACAGGSYKVEARKDAYGTHGK